MPSSPTFAQVALPFPGLRVLTYLLPEELSSLAQPGMRAVVPLGRRVVTGILVSVCSSSLLAKDALKSLLSLPDPEPVMPAELIELGRWLARYYRVELGQALATILPAGLLRGRERRVPVRYRVCETALAAVAELRGKHARRWHETLCLLEPVGVFSAASAREVAGATASVIKTLEKRGLVERVTPSEPAPHRAAEGEKRELNLHPEQAEAVEALREAVSLDRYQTFLLHGVTGSGKTEVYARVAQSCLERGRGVLIIAPEIALTPQLTARLSQRLGEIAVLHSDRKNKDREKAWRRLLKGDIRVAIGARSAVFSPVQKIGLVVVDEEHETTFKQDHSPHYHARDVAILRARQAGAVCILGSATPSLESYRNALAGKYTLLSLKKRACVAPLPRVTTVDLAIESRETRGFPILSRFLWAKMRKTLKRREQCILFLNRRGYATYIHCPSCGHVLRCRQCDIALTYHKAEHRQRCHHCGLWEVPRVDCPACEHPRLRYFGLGTEKVLEAVNAAFPKARAARVDGDIRAARGEVGRILECFGRHELDVLVGTQMLAKGHDFPRVTLVGVIAADSALNFPDFRAAERTFQLLTQVAGRAGRAELPGDVVIQSFKSDHFAIRNAVAQDFPSFYEEEIPARKALGYPPFARLAKVLVEGKKEEKVREIALSLGQRVREGEISGARVLGPSPSPISRLQGRFRWQFLIKAENHTELRRAVAALESKGSLARGPVRVHLDIDPVFLL